MIINPAMAPFAKERKNTAKADIFLDDGTLVRSFVNREILELSLIQEFYNKQSTIPRGEMSILFDNRDQFFDISNPESTTHILEEESYCEAYLSSVEFGLAEAYEKKCRYFFEEISADDTSARLKFVDAVSKKIFSTKKMSDAIEEASGSKANIGEYFEGVKLLTKYPFEVGISDEIANKYNLEADSYGGYSVLDGFYEIARKLSIGAGAPTYFISDDNGKMTFKTRQSEPIATITQNQFISCNFRQEKKTLISKISDRGNVLYQLGDTIEVVNGSRRFKTEIYRIHYKLSQNGSLSSEWEGVVLQ